jgi:transposase-like protein
LPQRAPATDTISYAGYRFPPNVIGYAVWPHYGFPLSLRMIEELLVARGIELTYETVRRWSVEFGLGIARRIPSALPQSRTTIDVEQTRGNKGVGTSPIGRPSRDVMAKVERAFGS